MGIKDSKNKRVCDFTDHYFADKTRLLVVCECLCISTNVTSPNSQPRQSVRYIFGLGFIIAVIFIDMTSISGGNRPLYSMCSYVN